MTKENEELQKHLKRLSVAIFTLVFSGLGYFFIVPVLPDIVIGNYGLRQIGGLSTQMVSVALLGWIFWELRFLIAKSSLLVTREYAGIVSKTLYIIEIVIAWAVIIIFVNNILSLLIIPSNIIVIVNNLLDLAAVGGVVFLLYRIVTIFIREAKFTKVKVPVPTVGPEAALIDRLMAERSEIERSIRSLETRMELLDADRHIGLVPDKDYESRKRMLEKAMKRDQGRIETIDKKIIDLKKPKKEAEAVKE